MDLRRSGRVLAAGALGAALALSPTAAQAVPAAPPDLAAHRVADGTAHGAVAWFRQHAGDASYEGYCETAVERAYGTSGVWPSANAHWQAALDTGAAHPGHRNPPPGAFVFWNSGEWGHVGVADGAGGFHSTSIGGAIGHAAGLDHFAGYLGWSDPAVPARP
ncbi:CHAP domain-containing protein [Saccharopolyspora cebuensis]|uniref:CHAP domain-containing protein n=1 Tax=Saccharopolyspora cebuensis TaxID=418759 RepID=A0ABV4CLA5_9PSEU